MSETSTLLLTGQVIPTLPTRDPDETISFYERLGFELVARYDGEQTYLIVRRDDVELHFFHFPVNPKENLGGCYIRIDGDADALHAEWRAAGAEDLHDPQDTDYGLREFALIDPSANLIRIGSPLKK